MSESFERRAETMKLARLLGLGAEDLVYLHQVEAADLSGLRDQVTEVLFGSQGQLFDRLAAASRLLPVALVAQLAERVFGPVLSARVTGLLDPGRAVELAARLPVPFLADIAVELDPRRARDVIVRIPPAQIGAITRELTNRREYVAMGRFVGYLSDASIRAALEAMDPLALLNVAVVLENKDKLPDLVTMIEPERIEQMIRLGATSDLAQEAVGLLDHLSADQRAKLALLPELAAFRQAS